MELFSDSEDEAGVDFFLLTDSDSASESKDPDPPESSEPSDPPESSEPSVSSDPPDRLPSKDISSSPSVSSSDLAD